VIAPWEYRHLRFWARVRFVTAVLTVVVAVVLLALGWPGGGELWLALFLVVVAMLNASFGYWLLTLARSSSPRT
jgi:hypothetical protein